MANELKKDKLTRLRSFLAVQYQEARWSDNRPDHTAVYIDTFKRQDSGTVMPPSPGVTSYTVKAYFDQEKASLHYACDYAFAPGFWDFFDVISKIQPEQLKHRSRIAAVAYGPLRVAELEKKLKSKELYSDDINRLRMPEEKSRAVLNICIDESLRAFKFQKDYILSYIKEHSGSSIGSGFHWADLEDLEDEDWLELLRRCQAIISSFGSENYGKYFQTPMTVGARARSVEIGDTLSDHMEADVERTRIIMFHFMLQCWSVFIPNKDEWYRRILTRVMRLFGVDPHKVRTPLIDGGQIYVFASQLFAEGYNLHAYDGKQWETVVGEILGTPFNPLMICAQGVMLGSGIAWTSLLGTICTIWVYSLLCNGYYAIILGDDLNIFSKGARPFKGAGVVEYQELDSKCKFILGVSYFRDPLMPRLQGLKLTVDNGEKAQHFEVSYNDYGTEKVVKGHHDRTARLLWYGMHFGYFGSRSLIDAIQDIPSSNWRGGSEMINTLTGSGEKFDVSNFPWINDYSLQSVLA